MEERPAKGRATTPEGLLSGAQYAEVSVLILWNLFHWGSAAFIIVVLFFAFIGPPNKQGTPHTVAVQPQAAPANAPAEHSKKFNF